MTEEKKDEIGKPISPFSLVKGNEEKEFNWYNFISGLCFGISLGLILSVIL